MHTLLKPPCSQSCNPVSLQKVLSPSCNAHLHFWHKRGHPTLDCPRPSCRRRVLAAHASHTPPPRHVHALEGPHRLLREMMLSSQDAQAISKNIRCSPTPHVGVDDMSLPVKVITYECVMTSPPKKRAPLIKKSPEGSCGLRPKSMPRHRGLASTSRDMYN